MAYLRDQTHPDPLVQLRQQRLRFAVLMLYALPFALTPLALGSMAIYRSLPKSSIRQQQQQVAFLRSAVTGASDVGQLQSIGSQIEQLDRAIQISEARRREFVAARPWAAAFGAVGIMLLTAWSIALVKLLRKRELLEIKWTGGPDQ